MTVSLVPDTLADYLLRLEIPFDASDLSEDGVFDAEPDMTDELDNHQIYPPPQGRGPKCFRSLHC